MGTLYLIFGDSRNQDNNDLEDLCQNIQQFDTNAEIIINHSTSSHPLVKLRHTVGPVDISPFIFGVFTEFLKYFKENDLKFDHLSLVSANQYYINKFTPEIGVNYLQFYNCNDWDHNYTGKDFPAIYSGNPIVQNFNWDPGNLHKAMDIKDPMVSNWEAAYLTYKTVTLCAENLYLCNNIYPNQDRIQTFPAYAVLKSNQEWRFPPFFGTFDPSNPMYHKNQIITLDQLEDKYKKEYAIVKRVNYKFDCPIKKYIREHYYGKYK